MQKTRQAKGIKGVIRNIARNVARFRSAQGLTLEEVAERSTIPVDELSMIEEGKRKETTITLTTLVRLAAALSVEPAEIVAAERASTSKTGK